MGIEDEGLDVQEAIHRAYENGVKEEHDRIVELLEEMSQDKSGLNLRGAINLLRGNYGNSK
jgi:hypothetical protein